ncbi:MAG: hypothetical protein PVF91_07680 [Chromatiales bacterium]|jgi:hypothetical protein
MGYSIRQNDCGLAVEIKGIAGGERRLLASVKACGEGRCRCPGDEYRELRHPGVERDPDAVRVTLQAGPGWRLDRAEVERCLSLTGAVPASGNEDDG